MSAATVVPEVGLATTLYDRDFYAWTQQQAYLLRNRRFDAIDLENLIEEIETLGRSEYRELASRLEVLIMHLLKWEFQPGQRSRSWRNTVNEQRRKLAVHLQDNPSLRSRIPAAMSRAYSQAKPAAADETGLAETVFPSTLSYSQEQLFQQDFWPGEPRQEG